MNQQLVFDLDDTLFSEREFVRSGFYAVDQWLKEELSVAGFFDIAWQLFESGQRGKIFDGALAALKFDQTPALVQTLLSVYREHQPTISLFEDAQWALNYFGSLQRLGMITDGYLTVQQNKVKALKIEPFFESIIFSDAYGPNNWKPSPFPYLKVMEVMNCSGEDCIYIGDNPKKDFVTAKVLGWTTVQICREGAEYADFTPELSHQADFRITSLTELKPLF